MFAAVLEKPSHALFRTSALALNGNLNELKGRLFRAAQLSRKRNADAKDLIEEVVFFFSLDTFFEISS